MGEMIERVARAIYESDPAEDQEMDIDGRALGEPYPITWDSICEFDAPPVNMYRKMARAAIQALLDPTEEMHNAARDWSVAKYGIGIGFDASSGCHNAMISAALSQAIKQET